MALTLKQTIAYLWHQIGAQFVRQEEGKGLSTNDYTASVSTANTSDPTICYVDLMNG